MKRRRFDFDFEHLIELLLIGVFAAVVLVLAGLAMVVFFPPARSWLVGGAATPAQAAFQSQTPAPTAPTLATFTYSQTPAWSETPIFSPTSPSTAVPSLTLQPTATPQPPPTPTVFLPTAPSSGFACDRPGWFPERAGLREHAIFQYKGHTYVMAAPQPDRHALLVARTSDLCHWEQLTSALTEIALDAWDGQTVHSPFVIEHDGLYILYYTGVTWNDTERILWATTTNPADPTSWVVQGEAFRPNHPEENWKPGDAAVCRAPMVLRDGDLYYLYYTGQDQDGGILGVAVANAPDGPWQDQGAMLPALPDGMAESPFVAVQEDTYYLFYHHPNQGTQYRTGPTPTGPWSAPFDLAPGWAHEIWQQGDTWFTSFLTDYSVTIFPLTWQIENGQVHPQIKTPSAFLQDIPIWAHAGEPAPHEVVLFRHTFTLQQPLDNVAIHLFADTRYEAWLDGEWLGRGPARFSYRLREYDVYVPGRLEAGKHTLAVLVQWAPNNRRSESVAPFLQGHVQGIDESGQEVIVRTNATWKAQLSPAWQPNGALVHAWGLIGPVELLDLSRLNDHWNQPAFDDRTWPMAVAINPSAVNYQPYKTLYLEGDASGDEAPSIEITQEPTSLDLAGAVSGVIYRPRSIPALVDVPIPLTVLDTGLLSPGFRMGELPPSSVMPYTLPFTVDEDVYFTIEAPGVIGPAVSIRLDGEYIGWQKADATRPDVYQARVRLFRGAHQLTFERMSPNGLTFSVSTENISFGAFPFSQGLHIGRRLLLAQPVSDLGVEPGSSELTSQIMVSTTADSLTLEFPAVPAYVVLDLGRTVHGRIQVDTSGPTGAVLDMGWDERLLRGTLRPLPYPGSLHEEWNQVDSWVLDGTTHTLSTLDTRAGRYLLIAVWSNQPVKLSNLRVLEERYPVELRGSFTSSDPLLNYIWQIGVDTLYPNMTDAYTDTPWRERGQWWGDAYVADHINRVAFGDTALMRRGLLTMADAYQVGYAPGLAPNSSTSNMTDYMMLWVQSLAEYVQLSGDSEILYETYPVLQKFMAQMAGYENITTGLLDFPQAHWWKFVYVDAYGYRSRYGQSAAVNALYYGSLVQAAYLAQQTGDNNTAAQWLQKARLVRLHVNEQLFSPSQQRYWTTNFQGRGEPPTAYAQAWPLAYGVPSEENVDSVALALYELIAKDPQQANIGLYGMYWVLDSLGRSGYVAEGLELIKLYYGEMLGRGATTWWERMDAGERWTQSLSHSWAGSPTWFLTTYVLGARAIGPNSWELRPALTGVESVSGVLPLGEGVVQAAWYKTGCDLAQMTVVPSDGLVGVLFLPLDNLIEVTVNERSVWETGIPRDEQVSVAGGYLKIPIQVTSEVVIRQHCPEDARESSRP